MPHNLVTISDILMKRYSLYAYLGLYAYFGLHAYFAEFSFL